MDSEQLSPSGSSFARSLRHLRALGIEFSMRPLRLERLR